MFPIHCFLHFSSRKYCNILQYYIVNVKKNNILLPKNSESNNIAAIILASKMEVSHPISQRNKNFTHFTYWSTFLKLRYFYQKSVNHIFFCYSKFLKNIYLFFFEVRKFQKISLFFCLLAFIDSFPIVCWLCNTDAKKTTSFKKSFICSSKAKRCIS